MNQQPSTTDAQQALKRAPLAAGVVGIAMTALIGWAAWRSPMASIAVLMLPMLMNLLPFRLWPWIVGLTYFAAVGNVELPEIIGRFFGDEINPVTGWIATGLLTVVQSLPFLLYRADKSPSERAMRMAVTLLALTLPPIGWLAWTNPLLAAGMLFPATGYIGLVAMLALLACIAGGGISFKSGRRGVAIVGVLAISISGWALWNVQNNPIPIYFHWIGQDTRLPPPDRRDPHKARDKVPGQVLAEAVEKYLTPTGATIDVIVFPESVFDPMTPADQVALMTTMIRAEKRGVVILAGATERTTPGSWRNTVMAFGAMSGMVDEARLPMPMGNWKLSGGVTPRPMASDLIELDTRSGKKQVAMSVCFEDTVIWPHPGLLLGRADVMVSIANTWATGGSRGDVAQSTSAALLARLGGVPLVRAVNTWESWRGE